MAKGVELKSIAYLLDKIYFIRIYQRGYKWDKDQLNDLLNDFKEFIDLDNKHVDEFYCLQPIVIKKLNKDEKENSRNTLSESITEQDINDREIYEVIDGQQRLTTINLILSYLENNLDIELEDLPKLIYEIRPESNQFLDSFRNASNFEQQKKDSRTSIDFFHMYTIYETIQNWFDRYPDFRTKILKLLTAYRSKNVRVIWYEVDQNENSIEVFRRFNVGKIPLNNAELIKAVFLKDNNGKSAAEKFVISQQWEKFENNLQDSLFWCFLNPNKSYSSRIEYLFDLVYEIEIELNNTSDKYGNDKYKVFRFFDELVKSKADDLMIVWDKVSDIYDELHQFYNHPSQYHYIGFLNNKEKKTKFSISKLLKEINDPDSEITNKQSLSDHLRDRIRSEVSGYFDEKEIKLNYGSNTKELRDFFLLVNIEVASRLNSTTEGEFTNRYPFNKHKTTEFDIEHIGSQTDKDPKNITEKLQFVSDFYADYHEEIGNDLKSELKTLLKDNQISGSELWTISNIHEAELERKFESFKEQIIEFLDNQDQITDKDSIGNLTLLNSKINRGYGNAFFPTKRRLIINEDLKGIFIPPATRNVFMKYYSIDVNKHTRWTQGDISSYEQNLNKLLIDYM
jgi:uncharacterized protein with ParB-like and HNH nuclease domain